MNNLFICIGILVFVAAIAFASGLCKAASKADRDMEEIMRKYKQGERDERDKNI